MLNRFFGEQQTLLEKQDSVPDDKDLEPWTTVKSPIKTLSRNDVSTVIALYKIITNTKLSKDDKRDSVKQIISDNAHLITIKLPAFPKGGNIMHVLAYGRKLSIPWFISSYRESIINYLNDNPSIIQYIQETPELRVALSEKNELGRTPFDIAIMFENIDMAKQLDDVGAPYDKEMNAGKEALLYGEQSGTAVEPTPPPSRIRRTLPRFSRKTPIGGRKKTKTKKRRNKKRT